MVDASLFVYTIKSVEIEFDPAKNAKNVRDRGLPFTLADEFDWTTALIAPSSRHGEARLFAIGISAAPFMLWFSPNPERPYG
ncbi:MAG: hypothetical protein ACLPHI_09005 [Terriglobales bacterium]|jgi:uncharacterized protein